MRFVHVRLRSGAGRLGEVADFYARQLAFDRHALSTDRIEFAIGETALEFVARADEPFYHFALLVPGNRFGEALEWASARAELLPHGRSGEVVFEFENWDAQACYFEDPAGNIVELIAHHGIGETSMRGSFGAPELIGLSELGLVGDPPAMAEPLATRLGLALWGGTIEEPGNLAFIGEKARTLILSPAGRGWLPTGRPAELHAVDVLLSGRPQGQTRLEGSRYRVTRDPAATRLAD